MTLALTRIALFLFVFVFSIEGAWGFGKKPANPEPPKPVPTDPTPDVIRARWEASQRDGGKWSQWAFDQLPIVGKDLLAKTPADIATFCPNYKNLNTTDKKNFWVYLLSAMTQLESGHRPEVTYQEAFNDVQGNPVISRGLLQISIESANGYGCALKNAQELHDPYKNLTCGIRILNRWITPDGVITGKVGTKWQGGARYWAVLRKDTHLANIRSWTKAQSICR